MFCKSCGKELADDAAFCNNCGTPVGQVAPSVVSSQDIDRKKEDNVLRAEVKPSFVWGYQIIKMIGMWLLTLVVIQIWLLDIVELIFALPIVALGIALVVLFIFIIKLFFDKAQYNRVNYKFYKTKVEYVDGFLNKEEKTLKYEHIREVTMTQNILERMFGLGRIRLYTNASSAYNTSRSHSQTGKNGIDIHCVKNVKENLDIIKQIIDEVID